MFIYYISTLVTLITNRYSDLVYLAKNTFIHFYIL